MPAVPAVKPARGDLPAASRRPHLRVVGQPRHTLRYVLLLLAVAAIGVFGSVSLSALAAEAAFEARALEAEIEQLELAHDELVAEVAVLESPERIERVAVEELGMVPAPEPAYLILDEPLPGVAVADAVEDGTLGETELADPLKRLTAAGR